MTYIKLNFLVLYNLDYLYRFIEKFCRRQTILSTIGQRLIWLLFPLLDLVTQRRRLKASNTYRNGGGDDDLLTISDDVRGVRGWMIEYCAAHSKPLPPEEIFYMALKQNHRYHKKHDAKLLSCHYAQQCNDSFGNQA